MVKPLPEDATEEEIQKRENKVKAAEPKAKRTIILIRHGQYNLIGRKFAKLNQMLKNWTFTEFCVKSKFVIKRSQSEKHQELFFDQKLFLKFTLCQFSVFTLNFGFFYKNSVRSTFHEIFLMSK